MKDIPQLDQSITDRLAFETIRVSLPAGAADVDLYHLEMNNPVPLVIIAHGFPRHRHNMSGWGRHLAQEGFVAAVPELSAWVDHTRKSRFISDLIAYLCASDPWRQQIDSSRIGLMGFSAGGLATLLAAAENPQVAIWIGLDPADSRSIGVKASASIRCRTVVLAAEPSTWNTQGNAGDIVAALPRCEYFKVVGAVHVDAEWPTDWLAEAVCGRSTEEKRSEFRWRATKALIETLL